MWRYLFHSGLSTVSEISNLSGRGVGLDVVKTAVQSLRGRIMVESRPGQGAHISLRIPLTLAFLDSLVVRLQNRLYTVPIDVIDEVFKPDPEQVTHAAANDSELVRLRDELVPVYRLQRFYQETDQERPLIEQIMVVVHTAGGALGLPVDEIIGQQQVTMKPLLGQLKESRAGAGCALLSSGEVAIARDCERLSQNLIR